MTAYLAPACVAVAALMAWAHSHHWFEGSHALVRYVWGMAWTIIGVGGFVATYPTASALWTFGALVLFAASAGAGTAFGYLTDVVRRYIVLRDHARSRYE